MARCPQSNAGTTQAKSSTTASAHRISSRRPFKIHKCLRTGAASFKSLYLKRPPGSQLTDTSPRGRSRYSPKTSGDLSEEQRGIGGISGLSTIQQLSRKSGLLVIFTPISELRDFIVRRLPKQNRLIEEGPGSVRFVGSANELAGYLRAARSFPGVRPADFQGNPSYIPLACDDTFPGVSADAPAGSSRMPRLETRITCLPGPPSCAPRRGVLDDSSHMSCLS